MACGSGWQRHPAPAPYRWPVMVNHSLRVQELLLFSGDDPACTAICVCATCAYMGISRPFAEVTGQKQVQRP